MPLVSAFSCVRRVHFHRLNVSFHFLPLLAASILFSLFPLCLLAKKVIWASIIGHYIHLRESCNAHYTTAEEKNFESEIERERRSKEVRKIQAQSQN